MLLVRGHDRRTASPEGTPVDGVERDADGERRCLHQRLDGEVHAEGEHELVQLGEEQCGQRGGDEVAATAEEGRPAEHDGCDGREEVGVALVGGGLVEDSGEEQAAEPVQRLRRDVAAGAVTLHLQAGRPRGTTVGPDRLEATAGDRALHEQGGHRGRGDREVHGVRDPERRAARDVREQVGRLPRRAAGDREDRGVEQGVHAERGHDRVEAEAADEEAVDDADEQRHHERGQRRRQHLRVVAVGLVGHDHDDQRDRAGHRQVDAALHDHEGLPERDDREDGREREHRLDRSRADAARRHEEPGGEQQDQRDEDRDEAARHRTPTAGRGGGGGLDGRGHRISSSGRRGEPCVFGKADLCGLGHTQVLRRTVQSRGVVHKRLTAAKRCCDRTVIRSRYRNPGRDRSGSGSGRPCRDRPSRPRRHGSRPPERPR